MGEITKSGHFGCLLPVQLEVVSCTGTSLILVIFGQVVPVEVKLYRYNMFWFSCFDQFSYFGHNFLISYPI